MKVIFTTDINHDLTYTYYLLSHYDPAGHEERLNDMGISQSVGHQVMKSKNLESVRGLLFKEMQQLYNKHAQVLTEAHQTYHKAWKKINDTFFNAIEEIAEMPWPHKTYTVCLSPVNRGISNIQDPIVIRSCFEDAEDQLRITAHEITMIYWWYYFKKHFRGAWERKNWQKYWAVNELLTAAVLGLDNRLRNIWSKRTRGYDNYLVNYPQLTKRKLILGRLYGKKPLLELAQDLLNNNLKTRQI